MWLIIALQSLGSILIDKSLGYIFPKTRARTIYRDKLRDVVHGFAPCIQDTSSPGNLERITADGRDLIAKKVPREELINKHLLESINFYIKRISQLNKRIAFLQNTIDHSYLSYTARLSDEFIRILSDSQRIFTDFLRTLESKLDKTQAEYVLRELKRDTRGYPVFESVYNDTVSTLKKITQQAHKKLPEVTPLEVFESLPKI